MEVRLGVDALNWQGRSLFRELSEIRTIVTNHCTGQYTSEFQFLDLVLHVGDMRMTTKNVRVNRRASSIACHLYFIGANGEPSSQDLYNGVAEALTVGALEIVEALRRSTISFEAKTFLTDIERAVRQLKTGPPPSSES